MINQVYLAITISAMLQVFGLQSPKATSTEVTDICVASYSLLNTTF